MSKFLSEQRAVYDLLTRRLREAREAKGLTQVKAAECLGKPQSFISKIEQGERRLDIVELKVIADLYGQNIYYFIEER